MFYKQINFIMKKRSHEVLFKNVIPSKTNKDVLPDLLEAGDVFKLENGVYGFGGIALELFDYFSNSIKI